RERERPEDAWRVGRVEPGLQARAFAVERDDVERQSRDGAVDREAVGIRRRVGRDVDVGRSDAVMTRRETIRPRVQERDAGDVTLAVAGEGSDRREELVAAMLE